MKKGFTLVELLAVVIILTLVFVFITPRVANLVKNGGRTETELIEQRVLNAAKEYVNSYDAGFYSKLVNVGDTNYVYKTDLINKGLIGIDEVSKLDNFLGVKGELLEGDKVRYTLQYINNPNINNPSSEYSNEELYTMITELRSQVNLLISSSSELNILDAYPVGSIYIGTTNTNPGTIFGGTWEAFGTGRTLVGVDTTKAAFNTVLKTGGNSSVSYTPIGSVGSHTLTVSEMPSHGHPVYVWANTGTTGNAYCYNGATKTTHNGARLYNSSASTWISSGSTAAAAGSGRGDPSGGAERVGGGNSHNHPFTGTASTINIQNPYITVYMWKRLT